MNKLLSLKTLWRVLSLLFIFLFIFSTAVRFVTYANAALVNDTLGTSESRAESSGSGSGDTAYYRSSYNTLEELYQAKCDLIRRVAAEGTVLLKNENQALPISSGRVTLLGQGSYSIVLSTTSGGSSLSPTVAQASALLKEALEADGLSVNDTMWDYYASKAPAALTNGALYDTPVSSYPQNAKDSYRQFGDAAIVVFARSAGEATDISRSPVPAANGGDDVHHYLQLSDTERAILKEAEENFDKVIVLLSGDFVLEVGELAADPQVDAIVRVGSLGYRGAYGLADVLTGKVSPSGRLNETFAADNLASPAIQNFGDYTFTNADDDLISGGTKYVVESEGIYIDYKYYETRYEDTVLGRFGADSAVGASGNQSAWNYDNEVVYPFGYGLSYTEFRKEILDVSFDDAAHTATVQVKVTNTGNYDGKDVVELYAQSEYTEYDRKNGVEKPAVQLVGFEKTGVLPANGGTETVSVVVNLQLLASYDYRNAKTYILEDGDYYFAVGDGAHDALNQILATKGYLEGNGDAARVYAWHQDTFDDKTYSVSVYQEGVSIGNRFDDADLNYYMDGAVTYLSRSDWAGTFPKEISQLTANDAMIAVLDKNGYETGAYDTASRIPEPTPVSYVDITTEEGLASVTTVTPVIEMVGKDYNDSGWDTVLDSLTLYEMMRIITAGNSLIQPCPSVGFPAVKGSDGPAGYINNYVFTTQHPYEEGADTSKYEFGAMTKDQSTYVVSDGMSSREVDVLTLQGRMYTSDAMLGMTWSKELAKEVGEMMGDDGIYTNSHFLWGVGMNLHRTPFLGRNTEYFSADPVHAGEMGGCKSDGGKVKGMILMAKHFALNHQETNRQGVSTFANEQALRENELRGFEIIMAIHECQGIMTSYNRIGLVPACSEYDLIQGVLYDEWGSTAFNITDLLKATAGLAEGNAMMAAGTSVIDGELDQFTKTSGTHVNTTLSCKSIAEDAKLLAAVRENCHRLLFNAIHSSGINGVDRDISIVKTTPWWKAGITAVMAASGVIALVSTGLYLASANRKVKVEEAA